MQQQLPNVLQGCLNHNTVHQSEQRLQQLSEQHDFTQQLLRLIPQMQNELLVMLLLTLKNYMLAKYNANPCPISQSQKDLLRNSLIDLYYEIKGNPSALELYKQIVYIVINVDFPWNGVQDILLNDLNNRIQAGIYFSQQVAKVHEYFDGHMLKPLHDYAEAFFPKLEEIIQQILSNFNQDTSPLLEAILDTFYTTFHINIPPYLRDYARLESWMVFFNCIMSAPTSPVSVNNQATVARIYIRLFSIYCNDDKDGKNYHGWAFQFRDRYASKLYEQVYQLVANRVGNEEILSSLVNSIYQVIKSQPLRQLVTDQQIRHLFYNGILLPLCESSKDELILFQKEEIQYVRRQEDLSCFVLRRAVLELISVSANCLIFNGKSQLMRLVEYCASILSNPSANDPQRQVSIRILSCIGRILLSQRYFKQQFQNLIITYFQPQLTNPNKLINSLTCELLAQYLPFGDLSPQTVGSLMEMIYSRIIGEESLVVRYNAILAFTALLGHKAALQSAKPHFQIILQVYVKTLNTFDHEKLLECLESIVKHFNSEIVSFAPDLLNHLLRMFCSLAKTEQDDDDQDQPDCNTPASATLSTVKEILNCQLNPDTYFNISADLIDLLRGIVGIYNDYFEQVLSLFAVFSHKAKGFADFQYPYALCRQLLEGKNLNLGGSQLPNDVLLQLSNVQKADSEFEDNLLAILKNIIQKAPDHVVRNYPWPRHQELILALIQNRRISVEELGSFDTTQVNQMWSAYLSSYSWEVFNIGNLTDPQNLRGIVGVSLFPWLKQGLTPRLLKLIIDSVDDQNQDEYLEQENTAQMLQKYCNQDDEDEQDYEQNTGTNYSYLYDSPYDCSKDQQILVQQVRSLSQQGAIDLANNLSNNQRNKLQLLMNNSN